MVGYGGAKTWGSSVGQADGRGLLGHRLARDCRANRGGHVLWTHVGSHSSGVLCARRGSGFRWQISGQALLRQTGGRGLLASVLVRDLGLTVVATSMCQDVGEFCGPGGWSGSAVPLDGQGPLCQPWWPRSLAPRR